MAKKVTIAKSPDTVGRPRVDFVKDDFDVIVEQKGLDVIVENAIKCPCVGKNNSALSNCRNCYGTGWVFINSTNDRAVVTNLNQSTKYKDWTAENVGTMNINTRASLPLNFMDRVTILDSGVTYSENKEVREYDTQQFIFSIYPIQEILEIFKFENENSPLNRLIEEVDYTFSVGDNKVIFNTLLPGDHVSIRYKHKTQYLILDVNHETRNSYTKNNLGREVLQKLPTYAVARVAHYVLDAPNLDGTTVYDNSYE